MINSHKGFDKTVDNDRGAIIFLTPSTSQTVQIVDSVVQDEQDLGYSHTTATVIVFRFYSAVVNRCGNIMLLYCYCYVFVLKRLVFNYTGFRRIDYH